MCPAVDSPFSAQAMDGDQVQDRMGGSGRQWGVFRIRLFKLEETLTYLGQPPPFSRPRDGGQFVQSHTANCGRVKREFRSLFQPRALCFPSVLPLLARRGHSRVLEKTTSPRMLTHASWTCAGGRLESGHKKKINSPDKGFLLKPG